MDYKQRPLGAEMRVTSNAIKHYIDQTLDQNLPQRLTGIEGMTMGYLFKHQGELTTSKDITNSFKGAKATVSQVLKGLVNKGFIKMACTKEDKRIKKIELTEKGREIHIQFDELFEKMNLQIEKDVSEEEKAQMRAVMKKIRDNIGFDMSRCDSKD